MDNKRRILTAAAMAGSLGAGLGFAHAEEAKIKCFGVAKAGPERLPEQDRCPPPVKASQRRTTIPST